MCMTRSFLAQILPENKKLHDTASGYRSTRYAKISTIAPIVIVATTGKNRQSNENVFASLNLLGLGWNNQSRHRHKE